MRKNILLISLLLVISSCFSQEQYVQYSVLNTFDDDVINNTFEYKYSYTSSNKVDSIIVDCDFCGGIIYDIEKYEYDNYGNLSGVSYSHIMSSDIKLLYQYDTDNTVLVKDSLIEVLETGEYDTVSTSYYTNNNGESILDSCIFSDHIGEFSNSKFVYYYDSELKKIKSNMISFRTYTQSWDTVKKSEYVYEDGRLIEEKGYDFEYEDWYPYSIKYTYSPNYKLITINEYGSAFMTKKTLNRDSVSYEYDIYGRAKTIDYFNWNSIEKLWEKNREKLFYYGSKSTTASQIKIHEAIIWYSQQAKELNVENIYGSYNIEIFDMNGFELYSQKDQSVNTINLGFLAKGVYMFRVENGTTFFIEKFIVSK